MSSAPTIGVDLGGTKMLVGVVSAGGEVLYKRTGASTGHSQEELLEALADGLVAAREAVPAAAAAGLGIPCTIDQARGMAIRAVNLPISNVPIRDLMAERLGLPVSIDNDGNVAALAEHRFGAARGTRNAVMITVGTGIGGGLILEGEVYRGSIGAGAELGHAVIAVDGPPCQGSCPGRGCAESLASGTAMAREGREAAERDTSSALGALLRAGETIDGRAVVVAAAEGDEVAMGVVGLIGRRIGALLTTFANIFEPEVIVVGGGVMAAGEMLLSPARQTVAERALRPMNETRIVAAELGPEAGMFGAAALAATELGR